MDWLGWPAWLGWLAGWLGWLGWLAGWAGWAGWLGDVYVHGPHLVNKPWIPIRGNAQEVHVYVHVRMNIAVLQCVY